MICKFCNCEYKLNVVLDRGAKRKCLRTGCCDTFLRWLPVPKELLKSRNLSSDERDFLNSVADMSWFGAKVASTLIQIESKCKEVAV